MRCFRRLLQFPTPRQHLSNTRGRQTPQITVVWARIQTHGLSHEHYNAGSLTDKRTQDRPKTSWIDHIHSWTGLSHEHCLRNCWNRNNWQMIVHAAKAPQRPLAMGMN